MNTAPLFVPEKLYHRRSDIHAKYGGQEQGGMITPSGHNLIFLVTGNSGRQHGYEDTWSDDGETFLYYGEGQRGDMKFSKGNLALRDHSANSEDAHLFEEVRTKTGYLKYKGQMICTGYELVDAPDTDRKIRRAIRFELTPIESFGADEEVLTFENKKDRLTVLLHKALADSAQ
jgi:5-methylcytosine-specific restriction protein A